MPAEGREPCGRACLAGLPARPGGGPGLASVRPGPARARRPKVSPGETRLRRTRPSVLFLSLSLRLSLSSLPPSRRIRVAAARSFPRVRAPRPGPRKFGPACCDPGPGRASLCHGAWDRGPAHALAGMTVRESRSPAVGSGRGRDSDANLQRQQAIQVSEISLQTFQQSMVGPT